MITQYHRPSDLDEALALVSQPNTMPLGGGTSLTAVDSSGPLSVVDLQLIGLDGLDSNGDIVTIGAMTLLQELAESSKVPPVLRDLAHREAPNTIRNAATLGGTIASAHAESELLAGLLAFDTTLFLSRTDGSKTIPLSKALEDLSVFDGAIITHVSLAATGTAVAHRTARTPADRPIVAVIGRRTASGETVIAATGLGSGPSLIDQDRLQTLQPLSDFRGSTEYRSRLAWVLTKRVIEDLEKEPVL
ncbi:MAG: FAD binding domain-containing protein [Actinomycetia bacterium]|nr:FAD binding domain-containing protein [Actinomycetes bacterium]